MRGPAIAIISLLIALPPSSPAHAGSAFPHSPADSATITVNDAVPMNNAGVTKDATTGQILALNGYINAPSYASLNLAHAAAVAAGKGVLVSSALPLAASLTATAPIMVVPGGSIVQGGSHTLAISAPFQGAPGCFSGFSAGQITGLPEARPEWWTANTTPGTTVMDAAVASAFGANAAGNVIFGAGDYLINNSSGAITVTGFTGTVRFTNGSRLVMGDNTKAGLAFSGGGQMVEDVRIAYHVPTTTNTGGHALEFISTTGTRLIRPYIEDAPCGAVVFWCCATPYVEKGFSVTSQSDALHFDNCSDPHVNGWESLASGDDGVSFVNNAGLPDASGGLAENIIVRNSKASGIKSAGQSNLVDLRTSSSTTRRRATSSSIRTAARIYRVPSNVSFGNGIVKNAGGVKPHAGNQYGIEYASVGAGISFRDIDVISPTSAGVAGVATSGTVTVDNVKVVGPGGQGFYFLNTLALSLSNLTAISAGDYSFYVGTCGTVTAHNLTSINGAGGAGGAGRAMWFADNASVAIDGIDVIDTQSPAKSYIVGYSGKTAGYIANINGYVPNGTFTPPVTGSLTILPTSR